MQIEIMPQTLGPQKGGHSGPQKISGWHRRPPPWESGTQPTVIDGETEAGRGAQPHWGSWSRSMFWAVRASSGEPAGSLPQLHRPGKPLSVTVYRRCWNKIPLPQLFFCLLAFLMASTFLFPVCLGHVTSSNCSSILYFLCD